jgi:hypothetical protein
MFTHSNIVLKSENHGSACTYVPPDMPLLRAELELRKKHEKKKETYNFPVRQNTRQGITGFYCGLSR